MHSLSSVVFCLSIHNNPYICFSKNLLTFNALTLYYFLYEKNQYNFMDGGNMDDGTDAGSCRRRSTRP